MTKILFPGSFDPLTMGHYDIIVRASKIFDEVVVAVLENSEKKTLFTVEERIAMIEVEIANLHNVSCVGGRGLTVALAKAQGANMILRGVRSIKDYEYEMEIAGVNQYLDASIETLLMYTAPQYAFVSSSTVKEMAKYHQNLTGVVSKQIRQKLEENYKK